MTLILTITMTLAAAVLSLVSGLAGSKVRTVRLPRARRSGGATR